MSQVTVITGRDRRRKWGSEERRRILAAAFAPGAVISNVARQFDVASSIIYKWRRQALAANRPLAFAPAIVAEDVAASPLAPTVAVLFATVARANIVAAELANEQAKRADDHARVLDDGRICMTNNSAERATSILRLGSTEFDQATKMDAET
jgi:transposase